MTTNLDAAGFFSARLAFQTDVSDVRVALSSDAGELVVIDSRSEAGWMQGHIPGALHLPTDAITTRAAAEIPHDTAVVTYCWGPGCNGATRAALVFARLGYRVQEMIGGIEYWVREGFPVETMNGIEQRPADPLTAPRDGISCAC